MNQSDTITAQQTLAAEAAHWQVRRHDGLSTAEEAEFQAWLAGDAGRHEAYRRVDRVWHQLDALPAQAVARLSAALPPAPAATKPGRSHWRSWLAGWDQLARPLATAMVVIGVTGAGWLGWRHWYAQPVFSQTYATARGQQLDVTLPDGSVLKLDTATRAQVTLYRDRRLVQLPEGQAMFTVTPDAARPFDVFTERLQVTVVGTRFSVRNTRSGLYRDGAGVQVEQGRVRVSMLAHGQAVGEPVLLTAGQYVQSDAAGRLQPVESQSTRGAMLWREGRVNFDRTPLAQAVAEFDRYGATHLQIADPAVAALRVNGSFDLRHADAFARTLPLVLPVKLTTGGDTTEITAAAPVKK